MSAPLNSRGLFTYFKLYAWGWKPKESVAMLMISLERFHFLTHSWSPAQSGDERVAFTSPEDGHLQADCTALKPPRNSGAKQGFAPLQGLLCQHSWRYSRSRWKTSRHHRSLLLYHPQVLRHDYAEHRIGTRLEEKRIQA